MDTNFTLFCHRLLKTQKNRKTDRLNWIAIFTICRKTLFSGLFLLPFSLTIAPVHGQPSVQESTHQTTISNRAILKRASSIRKTQPENSLQLANQALVSFEERNNTALIAETHALLARLAQDSKDIEQAKNHYRKAIEGYKKTNNVKSQIKETIHYSELFFSNNDLDTGYQILDELLPFSQAQGTENLTAQILLIKGFALYEQERFDESEETFNLALKYLPEERGKNRITIALIFHQFGQIYKHQKNYEKASMFHKKALDIRLSLNDQALIVNSLKNLALIENQRKKITVSLDYVLQAIEIQKSVGRTYEYAELLMLAGMDYRLLDRYEKSLYYLIRANAIFKDLNNNAKMADSLNQIGMLYTRLKEYDEAFSFYEQAIALPELDVPSKILASSYRELGAIELKRGNYDEAMKLVKKAHHIFKTSNNISKATITARLIGEIYLKLDDEAQAILYFRNALQLAEIDDNSKNIVKALTKLGHVLMQVNDQSALATLERALKIAEEEDYKTEKASLYKTFITLNKAKGQYQQALDQAEKLTDTNKLIYKEEQSNELVKAKAILESHTLEIELESLRKKVILDKLTLEQQNNQIEISKQASKIADLELLKNRYSNYLLIGLSVLCLCITIYVNRSFIKSRKHNHELDYLAKHDPLTGCYNRRGLFNIMEKSFKECSVTNKLCVIMADVDKFKEINDTYGHEAGDGVLIGVVKLMQSCIRKTDILARYGGEEFCIVLPGTSTEDASQIAEIMREKIQITEFKDIRVTCSFGISATEKNIITETQLISNADKALYQSKIKGRNRVTVWDLNPSIDEN